MSTNKDKQQNESEPATAHSLQRLIVLWKQQLKDGDIYETTPEMRDVLTLISSNSYRYELGNAARLAYLKHGKDSWCSIADELLGHNGKTNSIKIKE